MIGAHYCHVVGVGVANTHRGKKRAWSQGLRKSFDFLHLQVQPPSDQYPPLTLYKTFMYVLLGVAARFLGETARKTRSTRDFGRVQHADVAPVECVKSSTSRPARCVFLRLDVCCDSSCPGG